MEIVNFSVSVTNSFILALGINRMETIHVVDVKHNYFKTTK